jgi:hypothetical protein
MDGLQVGSYGCRPVLTRDRDIRRLLHERLAAQFGCDPDTEVVDELTICSAQARADVVVVNGQLAAFEIKSDADRLHRLPSQAKHYGRVFDRVTIVAAARHGDAAVRHVPDWWGVWIAGQDGDALGLRERRRGGPNPCVSRYARAQLLWRDEMLELLSAFSADRGAARQPRRVLIERLVTNVPDNSLSDHLRHCLRQRAG